MTREITFRDRLRYRFDATLSRGTVAIIAWLGLVTAIVVIIAAAVVRLLGLSTSGGAGGTRLGEAAWANLMHALDPGALGADQGWPWRIVALLVTIAGIFVLSILIGIISSGIESRLDELRKGRSLVVEEGHTLVLGWSPKLHQILAELEIANENQRNPVVVILADRDKVEMEDEVKARAGGGRRTRVICRSGSTSDPANLAMVRAEAAKSILVLLDDDAGDPGSVKAVLALMALDPGLQRLRVTAEFEREDSADAIERASDGRIGIVVSSDVIARVTAQVCRQSGLSAVFQELLDFDGDEIYFQEEPTLVGHTFGASLMAYEESAVIGVCSADGTTILAPRMDRVFAVGDKVIAISADDDTLRARDPIEPVEHDGHVERAIEPACETTLLIGWNALAPTILGELDRYVLAGSEVRLLVDPTRLAEPVELPELANTSVEIVEMDTASGPHLAAQIGGRRYDQVIILCYRTEDVASDDAQTLLTLLQVRQATQAEGSPNAGVRLVTELLDVRDVDLARVAHPDDFVVSERLTSLMLAQLSENVDLRGVFADLFDAEGVELVLVPASNYVADGELAYGDVVAAARAKGHVAVGFRMASGAVEGGLGGGGVVVNPAKSRGVAFGPGDQLLILA